MHQLLSVSTEEIAIQERVSLKIAMSTREYIHAFDRQDNQRKPALLAFNGNVYDKLNAISFNKDEIAFAAKHLRIFSALYGILSPLDIIQPYRLDMNSQLIEGLYGFWKENVTREIAKLLKTNNNILINLASAEYFKIIDPQQLPAGCRIITPVFKQEHHGSYITKGLFAKQARGLMTRFIIENQITDPEHLQGFTEEGYYFRPELSKKNEWIFTR